MAQSGSKKPPVNPAIIEGSALSARPEHSARKHLLDRLDRALLRALAKDARLSGRRLAELLGVAESTVSTRLRALVGSGVVRGFSVDVDLETLGAPVQAMLAVRLGSHSRKDLDQFHAAVSQMPGVLSIFHIAGVNDYLLHVAARDVHELRDVVVEHLAMQPAIAHTETSLVFDHWQGTGWQQLLHPDSG